MAETDSIAALKDHELALRLRNMTPADEGVLVEAAIRLERIAMRSGQCQVIEVNQGTVRFPRIQPLAVDRRFAEMPTQIETIEIRNLKHGEHRAFDRFGEVVIVHRIPEDRERAHG